MIVSFLNESDSRELNPDIVYTHFHGDSHLDHVSASLITVHAGRHAKNLLFYESLSTWTSFSPNYFVDIGGFLDKKIEALKMHRSQAGKPYMREVIRAKAALRGSQAGVEYGCDLGKPFLDLERVSVCLRNMPQRFFHPLKGLARYSKERETIW
jgi:hypothetical protein